MRRKACFIVFEGNSSLDRTRADVTILEKKFPNPAQLIENLTIPLGTSCLELAGIKYNFGTNLQLFGDRKPKTSMEICAMDQGAKGFINDIYKNTITVDESPRRVWIDVDKLLKEKKYVQLWPVPTTGSILAVEPK